MKKSNANISSPSLCHVLRMVAVALVLVLGSTVAVAQGVIRVSGLVLSKSDKEPLMGVNITDVATRRLITTTDADGRYAANVSSNATLRFSMVGAKSQDVKVKGRSTINVMLDDEDNSLDEITVSTKRITDRIMPEPTDIEVKGNYLTVRTRVRVPREMFGHDTRLVVQPVLHNVTKGTLQLMRPMVYDAREYNRTQDRLYNFNMNDTKEGDPLAQWVTVKTNEMREKGRTNDIIGYSDSVYVEHVKDEYSCDVYMAIENYNRILYRDTTIIARGTVNPLRWLDYNFKASETIDPAFLPKPEVQLRDTHGEVKLQFPIGKAKFKTDDPQNMVEIARMRQQIEDISHSEGATLSGLELSGQSSPDGTYKRNMALAQQRMNFALNYLRSQLPESMRQNVDFKSNARVATWDEAIALMRAGGNTEEADRTEERLSRFRSNDSKSHAAYGLPFYRQLLEGKYLPMLRRVDYVLRYSIYRSLTDDEIRQMYNDDYTKLTRFEYFKLYRAETDADKREKMMRQAIEIYPSYLAAANDLEAHLINTHRSDASLLRKFAGARAPQELNVNQMIALLDGGQYTAADSLSQFVDRNDATSMLLAVNDALNGRCADNYATIARTSARNEVVMLLALKRNKEALQQCVNLPDDDAVSHYLRAICLNRADRPIDAYEELKKAFSMDASLKTVATVDGDVNDLLNMDKNK